MTASFNVLEIRDNETAKAIAKVKNSSKNTLFTDMNDISWLICMMSDNGDIMEAEYLSENPKELPNLLELSRKF